jgi:hypothetical protein
MVGPDDEVFAITSAGGVIRTTAAEIKQSGRQTMGVRLVNLAPGQTLVAIARNAEEPESVIEEAAGPDEPVGPVGAVSPDEPADLNEPADMDEPADLDEPVPSDSVDPGDADS